MNSDHEMEAMQSRHQAWKDSLSTDHLEMVSRTDGMPLEMALHYMWVDLDTKIAEVRRPIWKRVGATLGVAISGALAYFFGTDGPRIGG